MSTQERAWPKTPDPTLVDEGRMLAPIPRTARCARCGHPAYTAALFIEYQTTLYFCSHHFRIHEAQIVAQADEVRDERHRLVQYEHERRTGAVVKK